MNKIFLTMAGIAALSAAAPALAQSADANINARIQNLQVQLQAGVQNRTITRNEAGPLREQLRALSQLERQYSRDGLSRGERDQLQQRIRMLNQSIRMASRNGDTRPGGNGNAQGFCPPGLAKKNNRCLPPGQAWKMGDRYNDNFARVPDRFGTRYRDTNRYLYRYDNQGRIYQVDRGTGRIIRISNVR